MTPGEQLFTARLEGEPVRAKHACTCRGSRPGTRPMGPWAEWRAVQVPHLRDLWSRWGGRGPWTPRGPLAVPVFARVIAVFPRPESARRKYRLGGVDRPYPFPWTPSRVGFVGRPDHDQVWKAGLDVLVQAGVLLDDPLVVGDHGSVRWYAAEGEAPHVEVTLWEARC